MVAKADRYGITRRITYINNNILKLLTLYTVNVNETGPFYFLP